MRRALVLAARSGLSLNPHARQITSATQERLQPREPEIKARGNLQVPALSPSNLTRQWQLIVKECGMPLLRDVTIDDRATRSRHTGRS